MPPTDPDRVLGIRLGGMNDVFAVLHCLKVLGVLSVLVSIRHSHQIAPAKLPSMERPTEEFNNWFDISCTSRPLPVGVKWPEIDV
jgi:hypothetical protein